jgi:anaphase-promoting complex subunit 2
LHKASADVLPIDSWNLDGLLEALAVDRAALVKGLATWANMGVLKETSENSFILLETKDEMDEDEDRGYGPPPPGPASSSTVPTQSTQDQQAEKMRVYWKVRTLPPRRLWMLTPM